MGKRGWYVSSVSRLERMETRREADELASSMSQGGEPVLILRECECGCGKPASVARARAVDGRGVDMTRARESKGLRAGGLGARARGRARIESAG